MNTLISANAMGFEAQWLTAWYIYDEKACRSILHLNEGEKIAGILHIGTFDGAKQERVRPDLKDVLTTRYE